MANMGRILSTNLQLDAWKQRAMSAEAKLKRRDKEGADLLEELNDVRGERNALQGALTMRGCEYDAMKLKRDEMREKYDEAVGAARGYQLQANQLEGVHAAAVAKTVNLAAEVEALQMTVLEKDKRISELEATQHTTLHLTPWSVQIDNMQKIIDQLEADLKQAQAEADWARRALAKVVETADARISRISSLEKKHAAACKRAEDWQRRGDNAADTCEKYWKTVRETRKALAATKEELENVKKMWSQTLDSRAILWQAIECVTAGPAKKKKMVLALEDALSEAYITKWEGTSKVVVLSDVVEDMYKALCPRCKKGKDLKKKGQTWGHVAQNLFGGESFVMCGAQDLRVFVEKRYDKR